MAPTARWIVVVLILVSFVPLAHSEGKWDKPENLGRRDVNTDYIVGILPDSDEFITLKKQRKPVQGQGSIDSLEIHSIDNGELVRTFLEPNGESDRQIDRAALSFDGNVIATGNWHGHVRAWDVASAKELGHWQEGGRNIDRIAVSADGKFVASAAYDDKTRRCLIHHYDVVAGKKVATFAGHEDTCTELKFLPDGRIVSGSLDETICVWDSATPIDGDVKLLPPAMVFRGHSGAIRSIDISPATNQLLSGAGDGRVGLWDLKTGKPIRLFKATDEDAIKRHYISTVAFIHGGKQFLTGGGDFKANLWDTETGQLLASKRQPINGFIPLPGNKQAITGFQIMNLPTGYEVDPAKTAPPNEVNTRPKSIVLGPIDDGLYGLDMKVLRDGKTIVVANLSGPKFNLAQFDATNGKRVSNLYVARDGEDPPSLLGLSPDGSLMACGTWKGRVWTMSSVNGEVVKRYDGAVRNVYAAAWTPDGKALAVAEGYDQKDQNKARILLWNVEDGSMRVLEGHKGAIFSIAVSDDGAKLVSGSGMYENGKVSDCELKVWDLVSGKILATLTGQKERIYGVAISHDASLAATGAHSGPVIIWDLEAGKELRSVRGAENRDGNSYVRAFAFSPDDKRLAVGGADSDVVVWDVATGKELYRLEDHRKAISTVAWLSADKLASASADGTIRIWDVPAKAP